MSPVELPEGVRRDRLEPLWTRVERNRWKVVGVLVAYVASITLSVSLLVFLGALAVSLFLVRSPAAFAAYMGALDRVVLVAAAVTFAFAVVNVVWSLVRSERLLLGRFGAVLSPTGQYQESKYALKDMAIASGFEHAPPLWVIPDCDTVNAFAIGRTARTAVIGITQGMAERLDGDEQRAVFANLMTRLRNGDVRAATAVSVLFGPIWRIREADYTRGEGAMFAYDGERSSFAPVGARTTDAAIGALVYFLLYMLVIVITELLAAGHERGTRFTSGKADAEGMLLLRDPRTMLSTLQKVLDADNTVGRAGESYSALFYCWAGFGWAPEDDPEYERIARLREVLGVEGLVDPVTAAGYVTPERPLVAPGAPRLEKETP